MERIKAEFSQEFYESLTNEQRSHITIRGVATGDYQNDPEWVKLKEDASKAYRARIKKEHEIRKHLNIK